MKASEIVKELQHIIKTVGDLEVDVSVAKQSDIAIEQGYLVADAQFVVVEEYIDEEKRIVIRDWPY